MGKQLASTGHLHGESIVSQCQIASTRTTARSTIAATAATGMSTILQIVAITTTMTFSHTICVVRACHRMSQPAEELCLNRLNRAAAHLTYHLTYHLMCRLPSHLRSQVPSQVPSHLRSQV